VLFCENPLNDKANKHIKIVFFIIEII
jgi:hypothetical protein